MIFNGIQKEYLTVSHNFTLPGLAEIEYFIHPLRKGGARIQRERLKELYIPVPVTIQTKEKSIDEIKVEINGWLKHRENKKLTFNFFPDYFYLAKLSSIEWTDLKEGVMKGVIEFVCAQPFRLKSADPLTLSPTMQTFNVGGQKSAPWTSYTRFTVPQSSYSIESNVGKVLLQYEFVAGDVLEIDYFKRDVYLNGKDLSTAVLVQTEWFDLPVDTVQLKASQPTELTYCERYY